MSEIADRTMIYDGRWKMVLNSRDELLKLFDTKTDPEERVNLSGQPDSIPEVNRLRDALRAFLLQTQYRQYRARDGR